MTQHQGTMITEPAPSPFPTPPAPAPQPQQQTEDKDAPRYLTEELPVGHVLTEG